MPLKIVEGRRSPYLYIRGSIAGVRIEESTGTRDRKLAEEYRAKREAEIYRGKLHGTRPTRTFAEAVVSYIEHRDGRAPRFLGKVLDYFGTRQINTIGMDAIAEGAVKVYPNASAATRNRQFYTPTIAVLTHAAKRHWCDPLIIERPKQAVTPYRWLRPDEAEKLIAACAPHLRPLVVFLIYTGARSGEALWLGWRDVDLKRRHVTFDKTKTDYPRGIPLHARVIEELSKSNRREGAVFLRPDGEPYEPLKGGDDTSAGARFSKGFEGARKRAGVGYYTPHDCRHTWATWHYQHNHDLNALMKLGGWKSEKMVLRYAHANVEEFAASIDKLPSEAILVDSNDGGEND